MEARDERRSEPREGGRPGSGLEPPGDPRRGHRRRGHALEQPGPEEGPEADQGGQAPLVPAEPTPATREPLRSRVGRWLYHVRYFSPIIVLVRPRRPVGRLPDPATPDGILGELAKLPISTWRYKWDPDDVRHLGPMAQDFAAAFGLGPDERVIDPTDAQGIALAAIQAVNEKVVDLERRIAALEADTKPAE